MSRLQAQNCNAPIIKVEQIEILEDAPSIPVQCNLPNQGHPQYSPISPANPNIFKQSSNFIRQNYAVASPDRQQVEPTHSGVGNSIIATTLPRILKECTRCKFKTDMTRQSCFNVIQMKGMPRNDLQTEPKALVRVYPQIL